MKTSGLTICDLYSHVWCLRQFILFFKIRFNFSSFVQDYDVTAFNRISFLLLAWEIPAPDVSSLNNLNVNISPEIGRAIDGEHVVDLEKSLQE